MKWFKHMTNTWNNEQVSNFIDEAGLEGYGFYWRVLEIIAQQLDDEGKNYCSYSKRRWGELLAIRHQTLSKLLAKAEQAGIFDISYDGQTICIKSEIILQHKDEWTRRKIRNSGVTQDLLRSRLEEDKNKKEEINTPPHPPKRGESLLEQNSREQDQLANKQTQEQSPAKVKPELTGEIIAAQSENIQIVQGKKKAKEREKSREPTGNSAKNLQNAIANYTENPALQKTLEDFRLMRERMRKPMTGAAFRLLIAELDKLAAEDDEMKISLLEQSIFNSWQGIFPLKRAVQAKYDRAVSSSGRLGASRQGNVYADGSNRDYGKSDFGALG